MTKYFTGKISIRLKYYVKAIEDKNETEIN